MSAMSAAGRDVIAVRDLSAAEQYKLLSVAVEPRPIAWVSTISTDGVRNLAPFSFFTVASRMPPTLLVSIGERDGAAGAVKDTLANIRAAGELVINIPGRDNAEAVALSSTQYAAEVDEFDVAGVTAIASQVVGAPSVAEALMSLECRFTQEIRVGVDVLVLAELLVATYPSGLLDERLHITDDALAFLGRLAGPYFTTPSARIPQGAGIGVDTTPAVPPGATT